MPHRHLSLACLLVLGLTGMGNVGCHAHVDLNAPDSSAALEDRQSAYQELQPTSVHETHTVLVEDGVAYGPFRGVDYLQLANGKRVYYPEDLLNVVDQESLTAEAAEHSRTARKTSNVLRIIGVGGIAIGAGIVIAPMVQSDSSDQLDMKPIYIGTGVILAGALIYLISYPFSLHASSEASKAYETYDSSLRGRLALSAGTIKP